MKVETRDDDSGNLFGALTRERAARLSDGCLIAHFVLSRDEAAFEALVMRHGPMVLRLCRRLTVDPHDAEDSFQATFLVLACQAGSLRDVGRLNDWLYRVAIRVALRARTKRPGRSR